MAGRGSKKTTAKKTTAKKTTRRSSPRAASGRGPGESKQGTSAQGASAAVKDAAEELTAKPTSEAKDLDAHAAEAGLSTPAPRRRESTQRPAAVRRNEAPAPVGIPGEEINRFAETGRQRRRAKSAGVAPPAPTFGPEVESGAAETVYGDVERSRPKIGKSK